MKRILRKVKNTTVEQNNVGTSVYTASGSRETSEKKMPVAEAAVETGGTSGSKLGASGDHVNGGKTFPDGDAQKKLEARRRPVVRVKGLGSTIRRWGGKKTRKEIGARRRLQRIGEARPV